MANLHRSTRARRKRFGRRTGRGAAAVELAILLPVLIAIIFGVIDFGIVLSNQHAVRSGAREAARAASVGTIGDDNTCSTTASSGGPAGFVLCQAKQRSGIDSPDLRAKLVFGPAGYGVGEPMAVCLMHPMDSASGVFTSVLDPMVITAKVQTRVEDIVSGGLADLEEPALPGRDWTFCAIS